MHKTEFKENCKKKPLYVFFFVFLFFLFFFFVFFVFFLSFLTIDFSIFFCARKEINWSRDEPLVSREGLVLPGPLFACELMRARQ